MTSRIALAVAFVAVASLGCSEKPKATTPQAVRRAVMPRKLGSYTMTVTPMVERSGRQARVQIVPDLSDGSPSTNPAGSVQVYGQFASTVEPASGNGCGVQSLNLPLTVTNFAVDPLANVQVQITEMSRTGFEACKATGGLTGDATLLPAPMNTAPGAAFGLGNYGTLAGSAVNTGASPGGAATRQWWFKYPSATPVTFKFVVWADPREPELVPPVGAVEIAVTPLTWTSLGSSTTQLQLCTTDPALTSNACPSPAVTSVTGTGSGPATFSQVPAGLVDGATYWWRAVNTFAGVVGNHASPWDSFVAAAPVVIPAPVITAPTPVAVPPATLPQFESNITALLPPDAPLPIDVAWTTGLDTTVTHFLLCDTVDCLPGFPGVGVLGETWEVGTPTGAGGVTTGYAYGLDASTMVPTDALSGHTLLVEGIYYVNVLAWDDVAGVDVSAAAVSAFEIIPSATLIPAPQIVSPLGPEYAAGITYRDQFPANAPVQVPAVPVLLEWTTDAAYVSAQYELCDTATCAVSAGKVGSLTGGPVPVAGVAGTAGTATSYSVDVTADLPLDAASGGAWLTPGIYYFFVHNLDALGAPVGAVASSSFEIVTSMPVLPSGQAPAAATSFLQNALASPYRAGTPITLSWTSPAEVTETWLELSYAADFSAPILIPAITAKTLGATSNGYSYDIALDLYTGADSAYVYLQTGTVYWRVYNTDPITLNYLLPAGPASNVVIAPVSPGWAVVRVVSGTGLAAFGGHPSFRGAAVEICVAFDCSAVGDPVVPDSGLAVYDASAQPNASHFTLDNLKTMATAGGLGAGTYYWRVVDGDIYAATAATGGTVPAAQWFNTGVSFTIP